MRLGDVGTIVGGGTPSTKISEYWDGDIPWLTPKDLSIYKEVYVSYGERNITKKGLNGSSARLMPKGSVLFSSRAPIGYIAIAQNDICTNQGFKSIIPNENTSSEYLYYWLKLNKNKIENLGTGTTFKEVSGAVMKNIEIDLPDLPTQRSISATLSALDDKIAVNNKINSCLEEMAKAIFKSWFVDFEPWGGVMPSEWKEGIITDIANDIICGKTPSTKITEYFGENIPFITIPDMHGKVFVTSTERSLSVAGESSQKSKTVPPNSICVSCIATAGLVTLTSVSSQTNQQINTIVCKDEICPYFVYLTMNDMSDHIKMLGSSGSTTNNLNKGQFSKIELIIPESSVMIDFNHIIKPMFETIKHNQLENTHLAALRDTLLPRLMSGDIEI